MKLKNEDIRDHLEMLLNQVDSIALITSGQCLVFDRNSKQIVDLQGEFASGESNPELLKLIAERANRHTILKFREGMLELSKEEFMTITHLNLY